MTTRKAGAETGTRSIVIADNDVFLLEAISELLRDKGYEVHTACDGLEALQAIRRLRPDHVILDILMPRIDGSRVCWLIRQDQKLRDTPVIAFSGLGPKDIRKFPELSADAYVAKGPLAAVANNILLAIKHLEAKGRGDFEGGTFGYEEFRPRHLITEMLTFKKHYEALVRMFEYGVLELDPEGRILMANARASEILGRKEIHLIAEPLPAVLPPRSRRVIQQMLNEVRKASPPKESRTVIPIRGQEVSVGFSSTVEDGKCTAVLVTLKPREPEAGNRKEGPDVRKGDRKKT